jgi:dynein heavy chain 1
LRASLKEKSVELTEKNDLANAKLKQMLDDQNTAEKEKQISEKLQKQLEIQMVEVKEKTTLVSNELAQVEPAVADAKDGLFIHFHDINSFVHFSSCARNQTSGIG